MGYLIKDTTKEERTKIVAESLGNISASCDGYSAGIIEMYQPYIDGLSVNGKEYTILKLLGKGKGGYSYLALNENTKVVLKQIHHEPCDYYKFGNKIEAEINDYHRLQNNCRIIVLNR